jgi:hypothetical protein
MLDDVQFPQSSQYNLPVSGEGIHNLLEEHVCHGRDFALLFPEFYRYLMVEFALVRHLAFPQD